MLKLLLLSGWFRLQPFLNYVVLVMLIAPLVAVSAHSSSAKQSSVVTKIASAKQKFDSGPLAVASMNEPYLVELLTTSPITSFAEKADSMPLLMASIKEPSILRTSRSESLVADDFSSRSDFDAASPLAGVELAPIPDTAGSKWNLGQKFPDGNSKLPDERLSAKSLRINPTQLVEPILTPETPVLEELDEEAMLAQIDPIGSPHPIPWKWILATQEAIAANGGSGVRHYRSVPVTSPDGRYIVYSRVQLEVRPEMYNSKVTSVMFVEDTQTKKLRVMASTAPLSDPLLNRNRTVSSSEAVDTNLSGKIGVLVPVSWSEKSDRFLARKFEGKFNTGDSTDQAVIWDRQKNHINTVAPSREEHEHEKIAVLLGWSKNQPDHALFRAGEMGEENWPLVQVTSDGQTVNSTDTDQPITFGQQITEVWAGPQFASR
ncbi:hypothetical protein [Nodularia sphaerocarpa]|uniref:hypothetical protein n=1 Tax=Nodularia sphaerocarpa TaxID=137816 RepID=UPI001EFBF79E|nr:hypothetical protein [Nodularia sphaerocarpa]MDB9372659.1 hypothetical protein [Nodularia sphaerocarpa CS-585]MDB9377035.1 hypothetical protein [Nodularia sphaerocarpa CS-585A2]ULP71165.1 hypothetical protein BDGGKGIB_00788 [Nodularia sphaerocarpa UHCC 0038]